MVADRHGRLRRGDVDARHRPPGGFRVRDARRFRRIAAEAIAALPVRYTAVLAGVDTVVEDVPPDADGPVPLADFTERRLTLYRRPIELRAENRVALEETLMVAIARAVAQRMGFDDDIEGLLD